MSLKFEAGHLKFEGNKTFNLKVKGKIQCEP